MTTIAATADRPRGGGAPMGGAVGAARDAYLDLLRAIAITMVVIYHVALMSPVPYPSVTPITTYGAYGVDIFFVLSGWLIGGLYWRESKRFEQVRLLRFLVRRWMRTIPAYLVALGLSWVAVWIYSRQPFDWRFLFFVQNYYAVIPFFVVSWSLCIEEHFYLVFPLGLQLCRRSRWLVHCFFGILLALSPISRWIVSRHGLPDVFGFSRAASHLRLEGLVLGFWAAYFSVMAPVQWAGIKRVSKLLVVPCCIALAGLPFLSVINMFRVGLTVMAIGVAVLLVFLEGRRAGWLVASLPVRWIAQTSYSVYLTNTLMIHLAILVLARARFLPGVMYFPLVVLSILLGGAAFYWCVEWTSLAMRDRYWPRRRTSP